MATESTGIFYAHVVIIGYWLTYWVINHQCL